MNKKLAWFLFTLSTILLVTALIGAYPFYVYNKVLHGEYQNDWFEVRNFRKSLLQPNESVKLSSIDKSNEDLWSKFHFMDVLVPLPVKNPFYNITADLKYNKKTKKSSLGLVVLGTDYKEILKVYFNENASMPNVINNQKLFKLPLAKNIINNYDDAKVWTDIFTKNINEWNISSKEMIYNLYLLELRSRLIPKKAKSFKLISNSNTALMEVESTNKDFKTELVFTRSRGFIYSYIIVTKVKSEESQKLRLRLLDGISFRPGTEYLSRIIYQEFKNLDYDEKTNNTGMLYLISSWSHDRDNESLVKEMIFYLQRASGNEKQLEPLINYAYSKYDKTFVTKDISNLDLDDEIIFKSKVELENIQEIEEIKAETKTIETTPILPEKNILDKKLDKAKKNIQSKKTRMIIE